MKEVLKNSTGEHAHLEVLRGLNTQVLGTFKNKKIFWKLNMPNFLRAAID